MIIFLRLKNYRNKKKGADVEVISLLETIVSSKKNRVDDEKREKEKYMM